MPISVVVSPLEGQKVLPASLIVGNPWESILRASEGQFGIVCFSGSIGQLANQLIFWFEEIPQIEE